MNAICGDCFANVAIRSCFVDTIVEFRGIRRVSQKRFHESASRFPPLAPAGCCSPTSSVLSRRYDALQPSRRTSFPSLGGTSDALVAFAPGRTSAPPGPGVGNPVSPAGNSPRSDQGSPKFLGNLNCPFANVPIRRRQDCLHQTITVQQRGPWSSKGKGSHDWVFRRSIAWLSDSLSTLRNADYSNTTQDSLPVAGQALLDGISTRKIPLKGFKSVIYISFPFPKLCLAQSMQPPRIPWVR